MAMTGKNPAKSSRKKFIRHEYRDIEHAIEVGKRESVWVCSDDQSRSGSFGFTGTDSWEQTVGLATDGWPEGRELLADAVAIAMSAAQSNQPSVTYDVAGSYPIAAIAAAQDPDCMMNIDPWTMRQMPIVKVEYNAGNHCGYETSEMSNFGAALLTILNCIELAGSRVEVVANFTAGASGNVKRTFAVRLKEAEQQFDLDAMAFCVCHPSFLRRVLFALYEQQAEMETKYSGGYGYPQEAPRDSIPSDVIYIQGLQQYSAGSKELATPENALKAFLPVIQKALLDRHAEWPPLTDWCDISGIE